MSGEREGKAEVWKSNHTDGWIALKQVTLHASYLI